MPTNRRWFARATDFPVMAVALALLSGCGLVSDDVRSGHSTSPDRAAPERTVSSPSPDPSTSSPQPVDKPSAVMDDPDRVIVPDIGVDAELVALGLNDDGSMQTPAYDSNQAGWYDRGPMPGNPGPAVIAAHVDYAGGPDVFARLDDLEPGDEIIVTDSDGDSFAFETVEFGIYNKDDLPYEQIWAQTSEPLLRLVTCAGPYVGDEYRDNLVVYAEPVEGGEST